MLTRRKTEKKIKTVRFSIETKGSRVQTLPKAKEGKGSAIMHKC